MQYQVPWTEGFLHTFTSPVISYQKIDENLQVSATIIPGMVVIRFHPSHLASIYVLMYRLAIQEYKVNYFRVRSSLSMFTRS